MRNGSVSVGSNSRHPNAHGGLAHRAAGACVKHGGAAALRFFTQPPPPVRSRSATARQAHAAVRGPHQCGACVEGARVRCAFANRPPRALDAWQPLTCGALHSCSATCSTSATPFRYPERLPTQCARARDASRLAARGTWRRRTEPLWSRHSTHARGWCVDAAPPLVTMAPAHARGDCAGAVQDAEPGCVQLNQWLHLDRQGGECVSRCDLRWESSRCQGARMCVTRDG